ncbi:hypothetical protein J4E90_003843 [Alternaria incomplexa]|uniref:uncharacterized protein n=1 Tax=Alternaria incomplexa TaxID=1187928 RepID=UPI00221FBDBF|nr:uncharacterized protein J4E90_003843 [Alternaria incomplexa]KAI4917336.1 hypothetical protein J4E90_003843 [Alternaria incomplexa]
MADPRDDQSSNDPPAYESSNGPPSYEQALGMRGMRFANDEAELEYLLSFCSNSGSRSRRMARGGPRPVPREEGLENIHFMNGRLVYHLALIKATNASLRDMGRTPETARQGTERRLEALKQEFVIFELNEKNEALARQLRTVKLEKEAVFNTAVRVNLKLRRTEAAAEETKSQLDAARLAIARIKTKKRALPGGEQNGGPRTLPNSNKRRRKNKKFVACVECFHSKTIKQCDGSSPCWPCTYRGLECKRMRCKYFNLAADKCPLVECTLAHSESGFPDEVLEDNKHVPQMTTPAPVIPEKPKPTTK